MRPLLSLFFMLLAAQGLTQDYRLDGPGPGAYETAAALQPAPGEGYWLLGTQGRPPDGHTDLWLLRLGSQGDSLWSRTYGGDQDEAAVAMLPGPDQDLYILGETNSQGAGEQDLWLLRLDSLGSLRWAQTYGGPGWDEAKALLPGPAGGLFVIAERDHPDTGRDLWLLHLGGDGYLRHERRLGGAGWDFLGAATAGETGIGLAWVRDSLSPYRLTVLDTSLATLAETAYDGRATRGLVAAGSGRWWAFSALNQPDSFQLISWQPPSAPEVRNLAVADTAADRFVTVIDAQTDQAGGAWILLAEAYTDTAHLLRLSPAGQILSRRRWRRAGPLRKLALPDSAGISLVGQARDESSAADGLWAFHSGTGDFSRRRYGQRGPAGEEIGQTLRAGPPGTYWLGGYALGDSLRQRGWLLQLDANGQVVWRQFLTRPGATEIVSLDISPDGLVWLLMFSRTENGRQLYVQALDAQGQAIVAGAWPGTAFQYPYGGIILSPGGPRVFTSEVGPGGLGSRARLLAFGPGGDTLWSHTYFPDAISRGNALAHLPNGDLLLAGQTRVVGGNYRGFLLRTDSLGQLRWSRTYTRGDGFSWARLLALAPLPDGGAWLAGTLRRSEGEGAWLLRVDANGDTLFSRFYPDTGGRISDATAILAGVDGGALLVGNQDSLFSDRPSTPADAKGWLRRVDAQGHTLWRQELGPGSGFRLPGAATGPGPGWLILGQLQHPAYADALLYRRDAAGLGGAPGVAPDPWQLYPNPGEGEVYLRRPAGPAGQVWLTDPQGRQLGQWAWPAGSPSLRLDLPSLPAGAYYIRWQAGTQYGSRLWRKD